MASNQNKHTAVIILFGTLFLIVAGLKMLLNLPEYKDVLCADEALYMIGGVNFAQKIPKGWGPLYSFWYFILLLGQHFFTAIDLFKLYFVNFKILAIAGPVLLYIFMILKRVHPIAAFIICSGYLMSTVNTYTWPHISHFTVIVLLVGLIFSHFFKSRLMQWIIILITVFITSYARPELFLSFALLMVAFIIFLGIKKFKFTKMEYLFAVLGFAFIFLLYTKMGVAMLAKSATDSNTFSRDVFAFGQHFAINYIRWNGLNQELWRDWVPYFEQNFEDKGSLISSGLTNVPMFAKHIFANIIGLLNKVLQNIADSVMFGRIFNLPLWIKIIVLAGFLSVSIFIGRSMKSLIHFLWTSEHGFLLMVFLFFAAPSYVACVLIFPREHYILLQMPFYLAFIAFIFFLVFKNSGGFQLNLIAILFLGVFVLLFIPNKERLTYFDFFQNRTETPNNRALEQLRSYKYERYSKENKLQMLENEGGLSVYTMKEEVLSNIPLYNTDSLTFFEFMDKSNIELIYVTPSIISDPILKTYPFWEEFINNPEEFNFKKLPIEGIDPYFLIKDGIVL